MLRKLIVFLLCTSMIIGCITVTATAETAASSSAITIEAVVRIFYAVTGELTLRAHETALADADHNGTLELSDATQAFYRVNGLEPSLPQAIEYTVAYRDVKDTATPSEVDAEVHTFSTAKEWYAFTDDTHTHIERYQFSWHPCDFDTHSLLVIPMTTHDRYIASVTADEEHLYITTVTVSDPAVTAFDRTAYAFVAIAKSDLAGKTPLVINYNDNSGCYVDPEETILNNYRSLSYAPTACGCEHSRTMVFQSVEDCETFINAHLPVTDHPSYDAIKTLLTEELAAYDDAFFETNVLLRIVNAASTSGFTTEDVTYCSTADVLLITTTQQVPMDGDVLLLSGFDSVTYVPVAKEHYSGQEIMTIERNRSRHIDYATVYQSGDLDVYGEDETVAELITSLDVLQAAYAEERSGSPDYTVGFDDTYFEDHALILVKPFYWILPYGVTIDEVSTDGHTLHVTVRFTNLDHHMPALYHGRLLVEVDASDVADIDTVICHTEEALIQTLPQP